MDYYRDTVTSQSWNLLMKLRRMYTFTLIGGWAVWLYTRQLKSKDIDILINLPVLGDLRKHFTLVKNEWLKKYEIANGAVQIDIYVPYWSNLGLPVETILRENSRIDGFLVPPAELLLILKEVAHAARAGSGKGKKDIIDIVSLLSLPSFDWNAYKTYRNKMANPSVPPLHTIIGPLTDIPELHISRHEFAKRKKIWLAEM